MLVKNMYNLSSGFIVCVLLRSISVATYGKCLFSKKRFENVWSINAHINPHGEAETLICWMFRCTFGFNSEMSNDLHICVHVTHVSTLIKLCGHEKPTCSQTQVWMSLLSMLEVLACLCKAPCSFVEDVSHLFCNVWSYFLFLLRQVNRFVYMCAMCTCRSWCVNQLSPKSYAYIFTSTMYKSWHGLEQGFQSDI